MSNLKDEILIQNILNGKKTDEKILYEKYKKIVLDYINFKYPQNQDTEDDVSEIMIKVFMGLNTFNPKKSKFKSWVISVLKNYMIDKWRNITTTITTCDYCDLYVVDDTSDPTIDFCECAINVSFSPKFEDSSTLTYLANQMSESDYEMLDLKYNQGFNYHEIGTMLCMSSCTVSNRVNYLKTKLKKDNPEIEF